jgi:hypothetical protein
MLVSEINKWHVSRRQLTLSARSTTRMNRVNVYYDGNAIDIHVCLKSQSIKDSYVHIECVQERNGKFSCGESLFGTVFITSMLLGNKQEYITCFCPLLQIKYIPEAGREGP